jgi:transposase InsO family protein
VNGFVYLAVILDVWSRRVVGYAISRSIDARLTIAALKAALRYSETVAGVRPRFRPRFAVRLRRRAARSLPR